MKDLKISRMQADVRILRGYMYNHKWQLLLLRGNERDFSNAYLYHNENL